MSREALARIDTEALKHNYLHAKRLAPGSRAMAVVKADAYGHGATATARALAADADAFGVASIEEALELREAGIGNRMVLLEGFFQAAEIPLIDRHRLDTVAHTREQVRALVRARPASPFTVWLKMDTGMHRLGLPPREFGAALLELGQSPHVREIIAMTHFARADELDQQHTRRQLELFARHTRAHAGPCSLANSSAVLAWPETHADWTRPGIMLYGASPLDRPTDAAARLRPAMTLESRLIAIRELSAGEPIGYGGRFVTDAPTTVGVVAMGYGDGYPRHARDGTPVAVRGVPTRLIGRVSMDMLTVDLNPIHAPRIGDPVELWGTTVSANDVAACSDTIAYELFTQVTRRVTRQYTAGPNERHP